MPGQLNIDDLEWELLPHVDQNAEDAARGTTAIHEAGHVITRFALDLRVDYATIQPDAVRRARQDLHPTDLDALLMLPEALSPLPGIDRDLIDALFSLNGILADLRPSLQQTKRLRPDDPLAQRFIELAEFAIKRLARNSSAPKHLIKLLRRLLRGSIAEIRHRLGHVRGESALKDGDTNADRDRYEAHAVVCYAGAEAERRFGSIDPDAGATEDLRRAAEAIARLRHSIDESDEYAALLRRRSATIIAANWPAVVVIATALMRDTTLTGEQMLAELNAAGLPVIMDNRLGGPGY